MKQIIQSFKTGETLPGEIVEDIRSQTSDTRNQKSDIRSQKSDLRTLNSKTKHP
ncbi:MAG: hypothetical protein RQ735_12300 [Flavobacteriaceae bacterium]|nr:hypothetical protein [Flavobacteriaceae bacterium]